MRRALLALTQIVWHCSVFAKFSPLHHSGAAAPYFDAPPQFGISDETPPGCAVDQAAYIVRHGARYPEPGGSVGGWESLFAKFQNSNYTASGSLGFMPSWTPAVDVMANEPLYLTTAGAMEAFNMGVNFRQRYGFTQGGENFTVWSASQQRVVDTASYFLGGYLSQGNFLLNRTLNRGMIVTLADSVNYTFANSLTPGSGCPLYPTGDKSALANTFRASYQPAVAQRLNTMLDGLELNATDIGPMMDLCGFQTVINGNTEFCDVFTDEEWLDYEYADDLNYYYGSGPGNPFSAAVGFPYVKAVADLLAVGPNKTVNGSTSTPPNLLMSFTHDNNIPPIISALGLWNESALSPTEPDPQRQFHSSGLVNFLGHIGIERLSCDQPLPFSVKHVAGQIVPRPGKGSDAKKYVRIRINDGPVLIPGCTSGPGSTCPLSDFANYVTERSKAIGDYIDVCGLKNVSNATNSATFFTNYPLNSTVFTPMPEAAAM